MSKRQSTTYTNVIDGKLVRTPKPLTKGRALVEARDILGPTAGVAFGNGITDCCVFVGAAAFNGPSWEQALAAAKASPEHQAWIEAQIKDERELGAALDSLKNTTREVLKSRVARAQELRESAFKKVKIHPKGTGRCACGKVISANRRRCGQCPEPEAVAA